MGGSDLWLAMQIHPESQGSSEHGIPNGFIPYSSGFKPSASTAFAGSLPSGGLPGAAIQIAGLTDNGSQKSGPGPDAQYQTPSFQVSPF